MVFVTGDTHGEFSKFEKCYNPFLKDLTADDTIIICGDFGGIWNPKDETEKKKLNRLSKLNFTIVFVDGNHENFDALYKYEIVDFHGAKAHKIRHNIFHIMRGEVFELEEKKFFAFGGASSHDIADGILDPSKYNEHEFVKIYRQYSRNGLQFRVKGTSWWEQELPTEEEMKHGIETLSNNDWHVDYVITHCLPQSAASIISGGLYKPDALTMYFNNLLNCGLVFDKWFCGHYHIQHQINNNFEILYGKIKRII